MKNLIKKILKEEFENGLEWIQDNSIYGEQLRNLMLKTGITNIPFESVGGDLDLYGTPIQSLGNLKSVGGYLNLRGTPIQSLGNLESVGGNLDLRGTPISKKYSEAEIRQMVQVNGNVQF